MKRIFTAAIAVAAIALAGATTARATTFPSLTTIYVGSGAMDNSGNPDFAIKTAINCTNMSGQTASVRYQFRGFNGAPLAGATLQLANLATHSITTSGGADFLDEIKIPTAAFLGGSLQVLSTQSAVFCSAWLIHAAGSTSGPAGVPLHMVRFNPHPGTVE